jgi:hypothetical protein
MTLKDHQDELGTWFFAYVAPDLLGFYKLGITGSPDEIAESLEVVRRYNTTMHHLSLVARLTLLGPITNMGPTEAVNHTLSSAIDDGWDSHYAHAYSATKSRRFGYASVADLKELAAYDPVVILLYSQDKNLTLDQAVSLAESLN